MDIYFYEVNFLDVSREILKFYQYSICIFCKFCKKKIIEGFREVNIFSDVDDLFLRIWDFEY